jgi:ubiquinone/menaquinone biosynthesis C-methylase UbiE
MRRVVVPELLDSDTGTPHEVRGSIDDLRWFNRYFGGDQTTTALLRRVAQRSRLRALRYLDVGGASGASSLRAKELLARQGVTLDVTVLDRALTHLNRNGVSAVAGDGLTLPFRDRSIDVVGSSLLVHHLEPEDVERFANEALRVARHAVVINDIIRSRMHYWAAVAGRPLYRSRLTRHDAPVSVRRAYTPDELRALLRGVTTRIEFSRHYFYRMGIILWCD